MPRACGLIPQGHWTRATPSSSLPPANNGDHGGAKHTWSRGIWAAPADSIDDEQS